MTDQSKERPILMHARSIKGILEGRKWQTRRIVKSQPLPGESICQVVRGKHEWVIGCLRDSENAWMPVKCPYGKHGDRLWVRETWRIGHLLGMMYRADYASADSPEILKWKPGIHMPRSASRLTLEITDIRVERVQDISIEDVFAEGIDKPANWPDLAGAQRHGIKQYFQQLWNETNGKGAWEHNDWVWVISFKRVAA